MSLNKIIIQENLDIYLIRLLFSIRIEKIIKNSNISDLGLNVLKFGLSLSYPT